MTKACVTVDVETLKRSDAEESGGSVDEATYVKISYFATAPPLAAGQLEPRALLLQGIEG